MGRDELDDTATTTSFLISGVKDVSRPNESFNKRCDYTTIGGWAVDRWNRAATAAFKDGPGALSQDCQHIFGGASLPHFRYADELRDRQRRGTVDQPGTETRTINNTSGSSSHASPLICKTWNGDFKSTAQTIGIREPAPYGK